MKPLHTHDCDRCEYVGSAVVFGSAVDIYRSCTPNTSEYLVRHSSAPADYETVWGDGPDTIKVDGAPALLMSYRVCQLIEREASK